MESNEKSSLSLQEQPHFPSKNKEEFMKATGIVRRVDYPVIIRQSQETQINQWFSLILSKENLLEIIISWDSEKVNKDTLNTLKKVWLYLE